MVYGGIDYSLNCPCLCVYDDSTGEFNHENCLYFFQQNGISEREQERRKNIKYKNIFSSVQYKWTDNYHRFYGLADWFLSILIQYDVKIIGMEDYSMGSNGRITDIVECTSILKYMMTLTNIEFHQYAPTLVKKCFSKNGRADKDMMCAAYKMRYNVDISELFEKPGYYGSPVSDIVDSHAMLYTYLNSN